MAEDEENLVGVRNPQDDAPDVNLIDDRAVHKQEDGQLVNLPQANDDAGEVE